MERYALLSSLHHLQADPSGRAVQGISLLPLCLLRLRVQFPPGLWISVRCECCVLSRRCHCLGLITRREEINRVSCVITVIVQPRQWNPGALADGAHKKFYKLKLISYKSYCSTVHFRRITTIYQPTNAHIISHKTLLKHFKTFRHVSILSSSSGALFLAKVILQYSQFNSYLQTRCCGSISCVAEQWLGVRLTTHT